MSTLIQTLSLHEVARLLKYKDIRSARRWCEHQNVAVLLDAGAKSPYVLLAEFNAARLRTVITYLKEKFGDQWRDQLSAYISGDIGWIVARTEVERSVVIGTQASRFFDDLADALSDDSPDE